MFTVLKFLDSYVFRCRWSRLCDWVMGRESASYDRMAADEYRGKWEDTDG